MLYFSTFIEVYLKRTEAIRSFTKFSIFSVVEYKETIHALPVSGLSNIENCQINIAAYRRIILTINTVIETTETVVP